MVGCSKWEKSLMVGGLRVINRHEWLEENEPPDHLAAVIQKLNQIQMVAIRRYVIVLKDDYVIGAIA